MLVKRTRKRKVFIVRREDPISPRPYVTYLSRNGLATYRRERAATFKTQAAAEDEAQWFRTTYPRFTFRVEEDSEQSNNDGHGIIREGAM